MKNPVYDKLLQMAKEKHPNDILTPCTSQPTLEQCMMRYEQVGMYVLYYNVGKNTHSVVLPITNN